MSSLFNWKRVNGVAIVSAACLALAAAGFAALAVSAPTTAWAEHKPGHGGGAAVKAVEVSRRRRTRSSSWWALTGPVISPTRV